NIRSPGRREPHGAQISASAQQIGDVKAERRVTTAVCTGKLAVDKHRCRNHRGVEVEKNAPAPARLWQREALAIGRNELVFRVIKIVMGKKNIGVRQGNGFKSAVRLLIVELRGRV